MNIYRIPDIKRRIRELIVTHKGGDNVEIFLNSGNKQQSVEITVSELEETLTDIKETNANKRT